MNKKTVRDYERYWTLLKESPMNHKYAAKVITLKIPESLVSRVKRMISKEKDGDWQFRNDNALNPWKLGFKIVAKMAGIMPGHGIVVLRITMDRRTDV
jgi:hypothetical protein